MKTKYIVKAYEEELGNYYFLVTVPEGTSEDEVYKNFEMAKKYVHVDFEDNPDGYDEHFEDMVEYRESDNGMYTFNHYLEEYCSYKVEDVTGNYDFWYKW